MRGIGCRTAAALFLVVGAFVSCVPTDDGAAPDCESVGFRPSEEDAMNGCVLSAECGGKVRALRCVETPVAGEGGATAGGSTEASCACSEGDEATETIAFDPDFCGSADSTPLSTLYESARSKCGWSD